MSHDRPPFEDHEIEAMDRIAHALDELQPTQRYSVLAWITARWMPALVTEFGQCVESPPADEP